MTEPTDCACSPGTGRVCGLHWSELPEPAKAAVRERRNAQQQPTATREFATTGDRDLPSIEAVASLARSRGLEVGAVAQAAMNGHLASIVRMAPVNGHHRAATGGRLSGADARRLLDAKRFGPAAPRPPLSGRIAAGLLMLRQRDGSGYLDPRYPRRAA